MLNMLSYKAEGENREIPDLFKRTLLHFLRHSRYCMRIPIQMASGPPVVSHGSLLCGSKHLAVQEVQDAQEKLI